MLDKLTTNQYNNIKERGTAKQSPYPIKTECLDGGKIWLIAPFIILNIKPKPQFSGNNHYQ